MIDQGPYSQWKKMDTYFQSYLLESGPDDELKGKINHFRVQYLLKVANIVEEEAVLWGRAISPWASLYNRNYHRCYSNVLLRSIEKELALLSGRPPDAFVLLNERPSALFATDRIQGQKIASCADKEEALLSVIRGGYTPSLQDAARFAASLNLYVENPDFEFPQKEEFCGSMDAFLNHPILTAFKKKKSSSPLIPLLEGFATLPIEEFFHAKKAKSLWFDSCGRVLHSLRELMKVSLIQYADLLRWEHWSDLIYEEMLFWLLGAEPYPVGELERQIQNVIRPASFFRSVQTGMSAFSEIIDVLIRPDSTIIAFDDCYYESLFHLKNAHIVRGPDYATSLSEQLSEVKKIDLLFVDFHNNALPGKMRTERHDVKSIFAEVLRFGPATLIVDNTIGFLNSSEIDELLTEFPSQNIIVYWSHQKFDLLGTDKVSGGSYAVYSQDERLLDRFRALRGGEIDPLSRQLLTHFFTHGAMQMETRKQKIFANGWYANQRIDPRIPGLVRKEDPCSFSIDVHRPLEQEMAILKKFRENGIPLSSRFSFGYNITSQTAIKEEVMRFSLGAEDQRFIDQFIDVFNRIA